MRRIITIIIATIIGICNAPTAIAKEDNIYFRKFDATNSLPDNNVRNLIMLPNGTIWIESPSMLNMFDGVSIMQQRYNLGKVPLIEYDGINCLYYDSRNRIWLKNRDQIWLFNIDKHVFQYEIEDILESEMGITGNIDNVVILEQDKYLIYDKTKHIIHYFNDTSKESVDIALPNIMGEFISAAIINEHLWLISDNGMLAQWNKDTKSIQYIEQNIFHEGIKFYDSSRFKITVDNQGVLWIITDKKVVRYNTNNYKLEQEVIIPLNDDDILTAIAFDNKNHIWIGSSKSGVRRIASSLLTIEHLPYLEVINGNNIEHNCDISQIYVDPTGGVWIATITEGVLYHHKDIFRTQSINASNNPNIKPENQNIRCILNEPDGTILFGTTSGLFKYDPKSGDITTPYPELASELCIGLYRDNRARVWVGTFHNGTFCIDQEQIMHYVHPDMPSINLSYLHSIPNTNCARTFHQTPDGKIYVSVYGSVGIINEVSGEIELIKSVTDSKNFIIRNIEQIADNKLAFNGDNGTIIYDTQTNKIDNDSSFPRKNSSCYDSIVDSRGLYWVATLNGLVIYNPTTQKHNILRRNNGIDNSKIISILEDNFNNVWITTAAGISMIKMDKNWDINDVMTINLSQEDGITNASFTHRCSTLGPDGKLYFGSSNGLYVVDPSMVISSSKSVKPTLLNLKLDETVINVEKEHNGRVILDKPLNKMSQLTFKHNEPFVTLEFSSFNYSNPHHTKYRYKLENFNTDWIEIRDINNDQARSIFPLLHPGHYTFKVQSTNNGSWWSDTTEIDIIIQKPWWKSMFAITVYILLILLAIYLVVLFITRRKIQSSLNKQAVEKERQRAEMEAMKMRFFVNVSHELRTPLSLIIIPLESLLSKIEDKKIKFQLETMHRNANTLLHLVNHLLDFRKIDMDQESLKPTSGDMNAFIESTYESFKGTAEINMINLTFESNHNRLPMSFDHGMMQKILNNLLSNAMKFTPKGGSVSLTLNLIANDEGRHFAEIKISDTGLGIPQKDLDFIFDRFFQASNNSNAKGTGIGLNLSKSYTELHGGEISVESTLNHGSTFKVRIPTDIERDSIAPTNEIVEDTTEENLLEEITEENKSKYKLLIVEDNNDFRDYLAGELQEIYDVTVAENGALGLNAVKESIPDLIISDVMMPEMDGTELCRSVKNNIETSHIPIILLTAHSSDESRLSSYESGADAFISKPFHWGVLHARIRNLIDERKKRIKDFSLNTDSDIEDLTLAPLDVKFIKRAIESIDRNLDNTEYSVETMSSDLSMNRMSIYRKFKSITEQTPAEFIRTIRLKRAAKWIESGKGRGYSLIEISEMFGFNTPKYFSKYFKEVYGETPMQYVSRFK